MKPDIHTFETIQTGDLTIAFHRITGTSVIGSSVTHALIGLVEALDLGGRVADPEPITIIDEEDRAKAAVPAGWLWFGHGPVKNPGGGLSRDIDCWQSTGCWYSGSEYFNGFYGDQKKCLWAIRAGSELARINGLSQIQVGDIVRPANSVEQGVIEDIDASMGTATVSFPGGVSAVHQLRGMTVIGRATP